MKRVFSIILGCLLCLSLLSIFAPSASVGATFSEPTYAPKLYGIIGNATLNYLVTVDQTTGHATEVGIINATQVNGLAYDRNTDTLYSIANCITDPELIILNRTTAEATLVGPLDLAGYDPDYLTLAESIAVNPIDGNLYACAGPVWHYSNLLIRVDTATGTTTLIAPITGTYENDGDCAVFINETLYVCDYDGNMQGLYTVNMNSGVATKMGDITRPPWYHHGGLAYNPETQKLLGTDSQRSILLEISPSTGEPTIIAWVNAQDFMYDAFLKSIGVAYDIEVFTASISPVSSSIVIGDSVTFNSTVSEGTAPYSYQWYLDGTPVLGATSDSWTFTPTSLGNYIVQLNVTDSLANTAESNVANVSVNAVEPKLVTFSQTGLNPDFTGTVLNVDGSSYGVADLPISFSWIPGSSHSFAYQSPLLVSPNAKQYLWTSTNGLTTLQSGSMTAATSGNVTGNYKTRFYLAVTSPYDSPSPSSSWFDSGTHITESVTSPVSGGSSVQYVCTGWTGTGSVTISGSGSNTAFTITQPSSIVWNWKTQYYLTVVSAHDSPSPVSSWFDSGSDITASVTSPASGGSGTRYLCTGWTGSGSVPSSGSSSSTTFTITAPSGIVWNWKTQYYLTVKTDPVGIATIAGEGWYDQASSVPLTAAMVQNYAFLYWDVDGTNQGNGTNPISATMNAPHTATAHYASVNPLTVTIQPTSATINLGQSVTFTSIVHGGTSPYACQWYLEGNPVSGANSNAWILTPSSVGIYHVYLMVTDSNDNTAQSETARIMVIRQVPVGGYSVSFKEYNLAKCLAANLALFIGLALFFVSFKRRPTCTS